MSKNKSFKTVFATIIVMLIVLASFSYVVLMYVAPVYQLNQNKIYYWSIRLFPLLIGIVLITIASILLSHSEDKEDEDDKLPPNSYDNALFEEPCDDPESISDVENANTNKKEEVPFISVFGQDVTQEKSPSYVVVNNAQNEALINAIKTLADKIDNFSALSSPKIVESVKTNEEVTASEEIKNETLSQEIEEVEEIRKEQDKEEPAVAVETVSKDESGSVVFKNYEGSDAKIHAHAQYDYALEYGYNLTFALVDGSISQVALSVGDKATCIDVKGKTLVIIPFEDETEALDTLDKLGLKYEIRILQDNMSFDNLIEGLL